MDARRILETARTNDLYNLLADAFNVLIERGEELNFGPLGIDTRYADISPDDHGRFIVAWYAEASAETAGLERDDRRADDQGGA